MANIQTQAAEVNISASGAIPVPGGAVSTSAHALRNRLHWLWAWEQAQQRVQPRHTQDSGITRSTPSSNSLEAPAPAKSHEATPVHSTNCADHEVNVVKTEHSGRDTHVVEGGRAPAMQKGGDPTIIPAASLSARIKQGTDVGTDLHLKSDWNRWPILEWEPQFLHVIQGPQGVRIWLRDFRLDPQGGVRILAALRRELVRSGIALAALTINGHVIWESNNAAGAAEVEGELEGINYRY